MQYGEIEFELTEDHIKLVRRLNIGWNRMATAYDGAPGACEKRPYGNQDWLSDVRDILTGSINPSESETEADVLRYAKLHSETATALQIILVTGMFAPGRYRSIKWLQNWQIIPEN